MQDVNYLIRDLEIIRETLKSYKHDIEADFLRIDRLQKFITAASRTPEKKE